MSFYIYKTDFSNNVYKNNITISNNIIEFNEPNTDKYYDNYNMLLFEPYVGSNNNDIREYKYFNGYANGSFIEFTGSIEDGGHVSAIVKYMYNGFLEIAFYENEIRFIDVNKYVKKIISTYRYSMPTQNDVIFKIECNETTYIVYVNETKVVEFEYDNINYYAGFFGLSGYMSKIKDFKICSEFPEEYSINGKCNVYLSKTGTNNLVINTNSVSDDNYVFTTISSIQNKKYVLYASTNEYGKIVIENGSNNIEIDTIPYKFVAESDTVKIKLIPTSIEEAFVVEFVQVTDTPHITHICETNGTIKHKDKSLLYIPTKNKDSNNIEIEFDLNLYDIEFDNNIIYATQNLEFVLLINQSGEIILKNEAVEYNTGVFVNTKTCKFKSKISKVANGIIFDFSINDKYYDILIENDFNQLVFDYLYIGSINNNKYNNINGKIDKIKIITDKIVKYVFNGALSDIANKNIVELWPQPKQNAPISVVFADTGEELARIAGFDYETGEFINYVTDVTIYNGNKNIHIGNYDIDTKYNFIIAESESGKTYITDRFENGFAIFDISDYERNIESGNTWIIKYVINNSYSVLYNDDDTCFVVLNCDPSRQVKISYESSKYDYDVLENCNLNPLFNNNNIGFITIDNEIHETEFLDVFVSDETLNTAIKQSTLIVVDSYDKYKNRVENADISVTAKYGTVIKVDKFNYTVSPQHMSGRYIYVYISPEKNSSLSTTYLIKDVITVKENRSKIVYNKNIDVII